MRDEAPPDPPRDSERDEDRLVSLLAQLTDPSAGETPLNTSTFGRLRRMAGVAWRTARATRGGDGLGLGAMDPDAVARLVLSLGELKGLAMKAGQILSYIDVSLPPETQRLLALLQTRAQPTPWPALERILRADLGPEAPSVLAQLDRVPVATASIGQVHRARRPDGAPVAVKIRHPGIDDAIRADFRAAAVGKLMGSLFAPGADVRQMIGEAEARFLEECDYALEASRQRHFRACYAGHPRVDVPALYEPWCGPRVLTSDWVDGVDLPAWLATGPSPAEREAIGLALYDFYVGALYRHGLFNADPHPGNLLFQPSGRIAVLDHGCARAFLPDTVHALATLSRAVRDDAPAAMRDALVALGARDPGPRGARFDTTRGLLRSFYGPLLSPGRHPIAADAALAARDAVRTKLAVMRLRLPGQLLFLFRIRFGLYAVLARVGAVADWRAAEGALTDAILG